jgi:hypothetical protein
MRRMALNRPIRSLPRNDWVPRFAERLRELVPMLPDAVAYSLALASYPRAAESAPEEAAEIYAREPVLPAGATPSVA